MNKEDGYKMYMEIQELKSMGFNKSQIARKLNISRPTLNKYYDLTLDEFHETLESMHSRTKKADKYYDKILNWLKEFPDISASQIYDWIEEKAGGYPGFAESTLRKYINNLRKVHDIPKIKHPRDYEAIEDPPMGQQMQVDLGEKWVYKSDGIIRVKLYLIAFVLSHSRYKYIEWFDRPLTTADVIAAHENAFEYFGGMPEEAVYDQDSLILYNENYGDLIYTYQFASYRLKRKLKVYMCRAADPESKGRIENVVGYVKNNFASHRIFANLERWNEDCLKWLKRRANGKEHGTTKKIPAQVFTVEKKYLKPVSEKIKNNSSDLSITYQVRKDNTIPIKGNRYSVPLGTYQGPESYVKVLKSNNNYLVYDFEGIKILAEHKVIKGKGKLSKNQDHSRKKTDNIDQLIENITLLFPDKKMAAEFLQRIRKEKSRYIRDQLLLIEKVLENKETEVITKALEYCIYNKLYSASNFKDIINYFNKEYEKVDEALLVADNIALNDKDREKLAIKPAVRNLDVYENIFDF
ncbi:MAG: IS21 family transposase [Bacillota bacterium]